jgi:hypothetical protein
MASRLEETGCSVHTAYTVHRMVVSLLPPLPSINASVLNCFILPVVSFMPHAAHLFTSSLAYFCARIDACGS